MTAPAAKVSERNDQWDRRQRKVAQERYYDVLMQPGILMVRVHPFSGRTY